MKSPQDIITRMQRQWQRKQFRLEMLTEADAWPMHYSIGKPTANDLASSPNDIREHVTAWKRVAVGEVTWQDENYRAVSEPISLPLHWTLERPSDWVLATASRQVAADYNLLEILVGHASPEMCNALISSLNFLQKRTQEELLSVVKLATRLEQGEARGRPLRLLAGHGVDTKFFERNSQLLVRLLDSRFDGNASEMGLHKFLNALPDGEHWLLLMPLQKGLLPFELLQVRSQELSTLARDSIQASRILIVENRQCRHLLPALDDTVAILGSGHDLEWLSGEWLDNKNIAYWGDIDTWGLSMLARARQHRPRLTALLCEQRIFNEHEAGNAVAESATAGNEPAEGLSHDEQALYRWLLTRERGRLEQEYLPVELVHEVLQSWG